MQHPRMGPLLHVMLFSPPQSLYTVGLHMKGEKKHTSKTEIFFLMPYSMYTKERPKSISMHVFELTELRDGKLAGEFSLLPF